MKFYLLAPVLVLVFWFSCAKERPIERISDGDAARFSKEDFLESTNWLQKVTIVNTGEDPAFGFVGLQSEAQAGKFEFTESQLRFVNIRTPYETSSQSSNIINAWGVTHSDRRLSEVNGKVTNVEEENDDLEWHEKRFFMIDWSSASISESASFPFSIDKRCWSKVGSNLVEGSDEVAADHITFVVNIDYEVDENCLSAERYFNGAYTHSLQFKYSFIPIVESEYVPYLYTGEFDPLIKKYGYFNTIIRGVAEDGRFENKFVMNRWDAKKTHTFYFAPGFPEQYKKIYNDPETGIIKKTNDLMEANDIAMRFAIEDAGNHEFGDLRYSFIKFVEELNPGAPLGFGPSDANPFTGEILAANSVIWTGYLRYQVERLNDQLEREKTSFDDSSLYLGLRSILGNSKESWSSTSAELAPGTDARKYFNFLLPQYTYGSAGNGFAYSDPRIQFSSLGKAVAHLGEGVDEFKGIAANLNEHTHEHLDFSQLPRIGNNHLTVYSMEESLVSARKLLQEGATVDEVLEKIIYSTAIHEFGHNLNLRHNFYGSLDTAHFGDGENHYATNTSSVMEYMQTRDENTSGWGQYDEAAIVYAYTNGEKDLSTENDTTYLYCTDEHASVNALCNRFDRGSTPSEIAISMIDRYEELYWIRNYRNDRAYWNSASYDWSIFRTMWDFKKFVKMVEDTYELNDVKEKLSNFKLDASEISDLTDVIQTDMKQATLISAAFYDAVLQQRFTDRPYTESYDTWSGALQRKGIASDKIFAALFLLGDDAIGYDTNIGITATSFLPLREDSEVGPTISEIIRKNVMTSGDMYLGFQSFSRFLYAQSAVGYRDLSGFGSSLEQLRLACFTPDSLELRFNIADVYNFSLEGEPAHVLSFEEIPLTNLNDDADYYFRDPTDTVAVININGNFYVASLKYNELAYEIITSQIRHEVLEMYMVYRLITEGRVPECS